MTWINVKEELPKLKTLYFITNGKDIALAKFNVDRMQWAFKWHNSCFDPTYMLEVKLPPLPTTKDEEIK